MSSKEVKLALKQAKESIQSKDYAAVVEKCEKVLAADEKNYHALVFLGVAYENLNDGTKYIEVYNKATEIAPDQLLAWQGLISFYEKNSWKGNWQKLADAYLKVINLTKDHEKIFNLNLKLANVFVKLEKKKEALSLYRELLTKMPDSSSKDKADEIHSKILEIVDLKSKDSSGFMPSIEYVLFNDVQCESSERQDELCNVYLSHHENPDELLVICQKLRDSKVTSVVPLEVSLSIMLDRAIVMDESPPPDAETLMKEIEKIAANSSTINAWEVNHHLHKRQFPEAREKSKELAKSGIAAFRLLPLKADGGLNDSIAVAKNTEILLTKLDRLKIYSDRNALVKKLLLMQVNALLMENDTESLTKAGKLCKQLKMEHDCVEVDTALCHLCLVLGNMTAAAKIRERLTGDSAAEMALIGWYHYHSDELDPAREYLEKAVEKDPTVAHYVYQLARLYWRILIREEDKIQPQLCLTTLLKAAKLDPYHSNTFLWLGRHFEKYAKDMTKAQRCYKKAYDLKPNNEKAAEYLVNCLDRSGSEEEAMEILTSVTEAASAGKVKWAWLRRGLYQVKTDPSSAIQCFQAAIRAGPNDAYCWQCLAEGYMNRGSYNAAMKTFTKANELDPSCTYNLFQLASIKQVLGLHLEAVEDYRKILTDSEDYVPALKGLAETHLLMAREAMEKFYSLKAVDNCALAIGYLTRAATKRPDLAMIWKLIGDSCSLLSDVPSSMVTVTVPGKLCGESDDKSFELIQMLELGARAYCKALLISSEDSVLWYDLGVNYFDQVKVSGKDELLEKSVNCLRKSISLNSTDSQAWSTLGVVLTKRSDKAEAQHCFIQAIQMDSQNAQAWANLGILYLRNDNIALAHEAFKMAQSMAPEYVNGWIGQAMVAESVAHQETADLFRHSSELALHKEAALGYGNWIASSINDGEAVDESVILNASHALVRYLDRDDDNVIALNTYSLLLERLGLHRSALEILEKAVGLCKDDTIRKQITMNHARLLCKNGQYDRAIEEFSKMKKDCQIPLGLAYFLGKNYEQASTQYEGISNESQVYSAMGMCAYWLGDLTEAKTHFFACTQAEDSHVGGLLSLCALGLLQKDLTLASAVVHELEKYVSKDSVVDIAKLTVMCYLANGELNEAVEYLKEQMKSFPSQVELTILYFRMTETNSEEFHDRVVECEKFEPDHFHKLCEICAQVGEFDMAYRYAFDSVICHPNDETKWLLLAQSIVLKIFNCYDFEKCLELLNSISTFTDHLENDAVSAFESLLSSTSEFTQSMMEIPEIVIEKLNFVTEMIGNQNGVSFEDEEKPKIDGKAVLLHAFIELVTLNSRSSDPSREFDTILDFYRSTGAYQYDSDVFDRDEMVYSRKCVVKKNSGVKFPRSGLKARARCLVYDIARLSGE